VVESAEQGGFNSLLVPTRFVNGLFEESAPLVETWTTVSALAAVTKKARFLVAVRPGFISPGLFAKMAATLDQISGGRIDINIVPGGIKGDFERLGEDSDHSHRYSRAEEFIEACRLLWSKSGPVNFDGSYINLNGALCSPGPVKDGPKIYLGGASERALGVASRQADTYLAWIESREVLAHRIKRAKDKFVYANRKASFGLRTHIVVRNTEGKAWNAAEDLIKHADQKVKTQRSESNSKPLSVSTEIAESDEFRLGRHLWNGISQVRVNCGTALVGTPAQVAKELLNYWRLGFDEFILSGFPHLEECKRVAEDLIPLTRELIENESR
jgi:alkanesulfonate monooxygenase